MTTSPLLAELSLHEYVRAQLAAQFPEADEETLADTLEGLTDLREMLARVIRISPAPTRERLPCRRFSTRQAFRSENCATTRRPRHTESI